MNLNVIRYYAENMYLRKAIIGRAYNKYDIDTCNKFKRFTRKIQDIKNNLKLAYFLAYVFSQSTDTDKFPVMNSRSKPRILMDELNSIIF